jgi:CheY-like chemotaxis protein
MSEGGTLSIECECRYLHERRINDDHLPSGNYLIVTVRDTGEGIGREDMERIFEPFYTRRKMGRSGTGIGLAVVFGIVRDLNGYIHVDSEMGVGTTFTLYFPTCEEKPPAQAMPPAVCNGTESILVVDDVREQRELARKILTRLGYQVTLAENGRVALRLLERHRVDLVVLDMIMEEDFDGLDVYRAILEKHPGRRCIIASGFAETSRVREALSLGVGSCVRKPYTAENLGRAVRAELDRVAAA